MRHEVGGQRNSLAQLPPETEFSGNQKPSEKVPPVMTNPGEKKILCSERTQVRTVNLLNQD